MQDLDTVRKRLRDYQREAVKQILEAHRNNKKIIILSAPTGSGKTITALTATLEITQTENQETRTLIFTRTRTQLNSFTRDIWKFFQEYPTVILNKTDMCLHTDNTEDEDTATASDLLPCRQCEHYRTTTEEHTPEDLYNTIIDTVKREKTADPYTLAEKLKQEKICPYHALQIAGRQRTPWTVMTYPYLVDPWIRNITRHRYIQDPDTTIAVIDEAHNLEDAFLRSIAKITHHTLDNAQRELTQIRQATQNKNLLTLTINILKRIGTHIEDIIDTAELARQIREATYTAEETIHTVRSWLEKSTKLPEETIITPPLTAEELRQHTATLHELAKIYIAMLLAQKAQGKRRVRLRSSLRALARFLHYTAHTAEKDTEYVIVTNTESLEIRHTDPKTIGDTLTELFKTTILLSGTMPPPEYIAKVWNIDRDNIKYIKINIKLGNIEVHHTNNLTSREEARRQQGDKLYQQYAETITKIYKTAQKHTLIVFPSYDFMKKILTHLTQKIPHNKIIIETKTTKLGEIEKLAKTQRHLAICAVAGGKLTEGIELVDEQGKTLISDIIIAGAPYPKPTEYNQLLTTKIATRTGLHPHYINTVKMWIKVRQALGRGIRSPDDTCRWWLLDHRLRQVEKLYKLPLTT